MSRGELDPGHLMSLLATTQTLQRSLSQLSLLYGQIVRGSTALKRIHDILKLPSGIGNTSSSSSSFPDKMYVNETKINLFTSVQFAYPSRPEKEIFNNLSMCLPGGKVIALVGQSRAGKSTVVSLLERFYDPKAGQILLNNHKLTDFNVNYLRSKLIGYISQEPEIFNTTIRENIRFGRFDATDEEVEEAAKLAHAHEFITHDLPMAVIQKLVKNAPILLMDEATSALDAESEAKAQDALNFAMKGRTVLIIAHRLSTVRKADLILVMCRGQIIERGTHTELMANQGFYYDLVQRQEGRDLLD
ncbi:unnamed protein product [Heterobilharzia americana]|nr:unnamed protein product [Heterobilharzia americana]